MKQNQGFIALSSVLMLSSIFLSLSVGMVFQAIGGSSATVDMVGATKAELVARGCIETVLKKLQLTLNYQGNESILIDNEVCVVNVIQGEGTQEREIQVTGLYATYVHRIEVITEGRGPIISIRTYTSVVDF